MKRRITITVTTLSLLLGFALWGAGLGAKAKGTAAAPAVMPPTMQPRMNLMTPPPCSGVSFAPATNFNVGNGSYSVAVGDFNRDGKPDLAVANSDPSSASNNVSVLLGDGMGGFGPKTDFGVGVAPRSVAVGDFNRDGKPDLAVANGISNNVSVLLGDGMGGFGPKTDFAVVNNAQSVAVGDFNLDGKPDLAVANYSSDNVSVLLGDGMGGFGPKTDFSVGDSPGSVAVGDFNGDGRPDLAVANGNSSNVSVLLGNGAGGFGTKTDFGVGNAPVSVAVGDFNLDGKPDLAAANVGSNNVSVLLGDGMGGFGTKTDFGVGNVPVSVVVGDFNGDSKPDLAVANGNFDNVSVLLGDGMGGFGPKTNFGVGDRPTGIVVGDFNLDGRADLATANLFSNNASVLINNCTPNTAPVAVCQDVTIPIVAGCAVNITAAQVDGGSSDPDAGDSISLSLDNYGPFGPGDHTVVLTVTDSHGESSSCSATVTVVDGAAPVIACASIAAQTASANSSCQATVPDVRTLVRNQSSDNCTHRSSLVITQSPIPGSTVGPGSHPITVTVKDAANNSATCVVAFTITDNTAPALMLNPDIALWPPDHMYRTLTVSQMVQSVSDNCSSLSVSDVKIEKVTSDEPDNVKGGSDGETTNDILIAADCKSAQLRSERDEKKNGRVYAVTLRVRDTSGNTTRKDFKVSVPINQSGAAAVQDAVALTRTSGCP